MVNRFPLLPKPKGFNQPIYPKVPVIYKIVNKINNKIYIGQTIEFRKRMSHHYAALSKNRHCSLYLQNSFNKHGVDNFYIEIIEECTLVNICLREQYWIETLKSYDKELGYNILINSPSPWYGKRTKEHCENISKGLTGKHPSLETRKRQSDARKGRFTGSENINSRVVLQFDKNMNFIKEYISIKEASDYTNIIRTGISNALKNRSKYSGGFVWKYKYN